MIDGQGLLEGNLLVADPKTQGKTSCVLRYEFPPLREILLNLNRNWAFVQRLTAELPSQRTLIRRFSEDAHCQLEANDHNHD